MSIIRSMEIEIGPLMIAQCMLLDVSVWVLDNTFDVEVEAPLGICSSEVRIPLRLHEDLWSWCHLTYALLGFDLAMRNQSGSVPWLLDHWHECGLFSTRGSSLIDIDGHGHVWRSMSLI